MGCSFSHLKSFGKVILLGEHAVVYGFSALAAGLKSGFKAVSMHPLPKDIEVDIEPLNLRVSSQDSTLLAQVLNQASDLIGGQGGGTLRFYSSLMPSAGLGSSAAFSVALLKGIACLRNRTLKAADLNTFALRLEQIFHGTPSGIDNTVSLYGGVCLFNQKGLKDTPLGKRLNPNTMQIRTNLKHLVIGYSGIPKNTKEQVARVRRLYEKDPLWTQKIFKGIENDVIAGTKALVNRDDKGLGDAMNRNMEKLRRLGLSTPRVEKLIEVALSSGALGAKLTGAGGGGCIVAFAPGQEESVLAELKKETTAVWKFEV